MIFNRALPVVIAAAATFAVAPLSAQTTVFDNFPGTIPGNVVSQCLECNQLNSIGQIITGTQGGTISSMSFILSSWALKSQYPTVGTATDFTLPITLDVYDVSDNAIVGSPVYSMTQDVTVPFRPVADESCTGGQAGDWRDAGGCHGGLASEFTFDPAGFVVGSQFGYTLTFSTGGYGPSPTGDGDLSNNPGNSLNFGVGQFNTPLVGSVDGFAYDGDGNGGLQSYPVASDGPLGDDDYTLYTQVDMTTATPEPASLVLLGTGLLGLGGVVRRRRKVRSV